MLEVKRQYWSCMGETVLKKSQFDEDTAQARAANRKEADINAAMTSVRQQAPFLQPPLLQQPPGFLPTLVTQVVQVIQRPVQMILNLIQAFPQQLGQTLGQAAQNLANRAEKAISQILTFFFGHKKDKTEEKEKRDRNDAALPDLFGLSPESKVSQKEDAAGAN